MLPSLRPSHVLSFRGCIRLVERTPDRCCAAGSRHAQAGSCTEAWEISSALISAKTRKPPRVGKTSVLFFAVGTTGHPLARTAAHTSTLSTPLMRLYCMCLCDIPHNCPYSITIPDSTGSDSPSHPSPIRPATSYQLLVISYALSSLTSSVQGNYVLIRDPR